MSKEKLPYKKFVWTPKLAYSVGLLATDGNLSNDGRHIVMRSAEIKMLETFRSCLNLKNKIGTTYDSGYSKNPCYRLQFGNVQFYNWLLSIGLTPAKTYNIGRILVPNKFFADFLRGHLDGDGSMLFYYDRYNIYRGRRYTNIRLFVNFISASKTHIKWLRDKISKNAGVSGALIKNKPRTAKHVPIWQIKFAKRESIKLLKWIYYKPILPCLERKRNIARNAIALIGKEKRRKYTRIINTKPN